MVKGLLKTKCFQLLTSSGLKILGIIIHLGRPINEQSCRRAIHVHRPPRPNEVGDGGWCFQVPNFAAKTTIFISAFFLNTYLKTFQIISWSNSAVVWYIFESKVLKKNVLFCWTRNLYCDLWRKMFILFNKTADNRVFPTPCCLEINTDQRYMKICILITLRVFIYKFCTDTIELEEIMYFS